MINSTIKEEKFYGLHNTKPNGTQYSKMPVGWIVKDIHSVLINAKCNTEVLEKFDKLPSNKITAVLKQYMQTAEIGLFYDLYVNLGVGIKELKPRILYAVTKVSFKDGEKRKIWDLYADFNDYDDFIEEHNAEIIKQIDELLAL